MALDVERIREHLSKMKCNPEGFSREERALDLMTPEQQEEYFEGQREAREQANDMWNAQERIYGTGKKNL